MLDLVIMMVAFSKLDIMHGWILGLMIIKTLWEVFKIAIICTTQGRR